VAEHAARRSRAPWARSAGRRARGVGFEDGGGDAPDPPGERGWAAEMSIFKLYLGRGQDFSGEMLTLYRLPQDGLRRIFGLALASLVPMGIVGQVGDIGQDHTTAPSQDVAQG
jgi:hypothetical protein